MNDDLKLAYAKQFQRSHCCGKCPFVKDEVDVEVGTIRSCDHVCCMEDPQEIVKYMNDWEQGISSYSEDKEEPF